MTTKYELKLRRRSVAIHTAYTHFHPKSLHLSSCADETPMWKRDEILVKCFYDIWFIYCNTVPSFGAARVYECGSSLVSTWLHRHRIEWNARINEEKNNKLNIHVSAAVRLHHERTMFPWKYRLFHLTFHVMCLVPTIGNPSKKCTIKRRKEQIRNNNNSKQQQNHHHQHTDGRRQTKVSERIIEQSWGTTQKKK